MIMPLVIEHADLMSNVEQGMSNVEQGMSNVEVLFLFYLAVPKAC